MGKMLVRDSSTRAKAPENALMQQGAHSLRVSHCIIPTEHRPLGYFTVKIQAGRIGVNFLR